MRHIVVRSTWFRRHRVTLGIVTGPVITVIAAAIVFYTVLPSTARLFGVRERAITADLDAAGSLSVAMRDRIDFSRGTDAAYWHLDKAADSPITVLGVDGPDGPLKLHTGYGLPPDTYTVANEGLRLRVDARGAEGASEGTFTVHYRVDDIARRWADTAELFYVFVDEDEPGRGTMERAVVSLTLPRRAAGGPVQAWLYGPPFGHVRVSPDGTVRCEARDLDADSPMEVRVAFAADALRKVAPSQTERLDTIVEEETDRSMMMSIARRRAREAHAADERSAAAALRFGLIAAGVGVLWFLILYLVYGREYTPSFDKPYSQEIPEDLPPAVVGYLWRMGEMDGNAVAATIVDLAARGALTIERGGTRLSPDPDGRTTTTGYRLVGTGEPVGGLERSERRLYSLLFDSIADGGVLDIDDLRRFGRENPVQFATEFESWVDGVKATAEAEGLFEPISRGAEKAAAWSAAALAAVSIAAAMASSSPATLVALPVAVSMYLGRRALRRRSLRGAELHARYRALRNYLRDYGRLGEKGPDSVILWERYLVLAIVFGLADASAKELRVRWSADESDLGPEVTFATALAKMSR